MSIHQFGDGMCTDPQVNTSYYYEWINVVIILYLYSISLISDTIDTLYMKLNDMFYYYQGVVALIPRNQFQVQIRL